MTFIIDAFTAVRDFFETGGDVLYAVLFVTIAMWTFIIERLWYFHAVMPVEVGNIVEIWDDRDDTTSWNAQRIREQMISEVSVDAHKYILLIKTLMAILPLLGLLGTVTGMVSVFDVMALTGTGNARLMAGGVSKATIPTMSGLVAALSGLYLATYLEHKANQQVEVVEDLLVRH